MLYKYLLLSAICVLIHQVVASQSITKSSNSSISGAICPGVNTGYTVSLPSGFGACKIEWSATNGQVVSTSGANATIKWDDLPGATGTVTATFSDCGSANEDNNGKFVSKAELILSVKNQAWGSYGNSTSLDYCTKAKVNVIVPRMFVQGTGGIGQPPLTEVSYAWNIPDGWREAGTGRTGSFGTSTNLVSIEPINCSVPGLVTVYGTLVGAGPYCNSSEKSATATISLNGANPVATVGPQAGYTGGSACNTMPVTFYATTSVALGCISSYNWTYPPSWTLVSQSGNSINLKPSGTSADANPIKATINFTCGSSITSAAYVPSFTPPTIAGPDPVCSSASYTLQNVLPGSAITWTSSNVNGLSINQSGSAVRQNNFDGQVTLTATLNSCGYNVNRNVWVGKPANIGGTFTGPSSVTRGQIVSYYIPKHDHPKFRND